MQAKSGSRLERQPLLFSDGVVIFIYQQSTQSMGTLTKSATDQRTEISEVQLAVINRVNHFGNYVFIFCYVTNPSANQISKTQPCLCMNNKESSIAQYNHEWSLINIEYDIRIDISAISSYFSSVAVSFFCTILQEATSHPFHLSKK